MKTFISQNILSEIEQFFSEWWGFSFGATAKLLAVLQCSSVTIWGETLYLKTFLIFHFRILSGKFSTFCRDFAAGFSKIQSRCREDHFEKILVFENVHKFWLLRNQQNYFAFWQKLVNRAAKTVLYGSEQLFEGKYFFNEMPFSRFFSDNERRQFKLLTENFQYGPHNRILCLQRKTLIYNLFPGKFFHFILFSNLGTKQKLFGLLTVFFSRFPKKHFTCGGWSFRGRKNFLKSSSIHVFWTLS